MMKKLCLIDGYGFVFRAYHSLPPLLSPKGVPVSAVYGFLNMLMKILKSHEYDAFAVVLDSGHKNFRHDLYSEYKANRKEAPDDLKIQFPIIREATLAFNIKVIEQIGFEADDLIASYAKFAKKSGYSTTVVTSDKDLMSLMSDDSVTLYDPVKNKAVTLEDVLKKFGVEPSLVVDAIALIGDVSDNIPGVKGIGVKGASTLLNAYGSLDLIYENLDSIKQPRTRNLLLENKKNAFLSRELATLSEDIPLTENLEDLKANDYDKQTLGSFLSKYGFKSFFHKFGIDPNAQYTNTALPGFDIPQNQVKNIKNIKTISIFDIQKILPDIIKFGILPIYIEEEKFSFFVCDTINEILLTENTSLIDILQALGAVLQDSSVIKVSWNVKDLIHYYTEFDYIEDISVMAYTIRMGKYKYDILSLAEQYLDTNHVDAEVVYLLYKKLKQELFRQSKMELYYTIDRPLVKLLARMEDVGICVDVDVLDKLSSDFKLRLASLEKKIYDLAGKTFNIASPKQVGDILFSDSKTTTAKKSKKSGNYIVDSDTLEELSDNHNPIAPLILEWRQIFKLLTTYTEGLKDSINTENSRIHSTFEMTATATGRLSSKNPNLQNIPIRTKDGANIRKAFVAKEGCVLLSADYSQIELRLLASIADVKDLKTAFANHQDIHTITASQIFGVPIEHVDDDLRRQAKAVNFGIIYGISSFGLAKNLGITKSEAETYINAYFKQYPGILEYMEKTIAFARQHGFVETMFGRKCYVDGLNSQHYNARQFAERAAINAPLQGTASDIIKKAMVSLPEHILKYLVLQIHDELLFEVPEVMAEELKVKIQSVMENATALSVPLLVECAYNKSWYKK